MASTSSAIAALIRRSSVPISWSDHRWPAMTSMASNIGRDRWSRVDW